MTREELSNLVEESKNFDEQTQFLAKFLAEITLHLSTKINKLDYRLELAEKNIELLLPFLKTIAINQNPIFAFEQEEQEETEED